MPEDKGLTRSEREEKTLQFWKDKKIFEQTLKKKSPKGEFIFYEGPPTANGKPGIHHLESRAFKDAIPRYKTMRGFRVPRKAGWDTHGLPVEIEAEKKLGLTSKREIEEYGVARFNDECKRSVFAYIDEWTRFTERIGYWVNLEDAYFTFNNSYMEAVWKIVSHVNDRGLLYRDYKVVPWCPRCGTGLSSHELAQGYQDVKDLSLYVKFQVLREQENRKSSGRFAQPDLPIFLLAWTTTPWTLPGNLALAVGKDIQYVKIRRGEEFYLLAEERLSVVEGEYEIVERMLGEKLVGLSYEALYPSEEKTDKTHKVYVADFVTTEDGTGIVHTAVMYGQEDFDLGTKIGLPKQHIVSPDGLFTHGPFKGRSVVDETLSVDILKDLQSRGLLFAKENHLHSYPFCWRCKTRLIYYARDSWYIAMSKLRSELIKENEKINWEPEHVKRGRFGEWLREVKDWALSRERYWGTPLPIWLSDDKEPLVIDSIDTLKKYAKPSRNTYTVMRHGQAENNVRRIVSAKIDNGHRLSELGQKQVKETAKKFGRYDLIVSSPFVRTKETAKIVAQELGLPESEIVLDERLSEFGAGDFEGKSEDLLHEFLHSRNMFDEKSHNGESFQETKRRLGEALADLEERHEGKKILIITHKICAWLLMAVGERLGPEEAEALDVYLNNGEARPLQLLTLPHNADFEVDLHKPFIDEVLLVKDGKEYRRTREVMDVWLDSGAVPFAQDPEEVRFPADFISEGLDQTRGWFYTLHAVGAIMRHSRAYENVICLGLILDKEGKKMSKSVGNIVEPFSAIERYGVDTLRLWMYSVNQPGDNKNFDEKTVGDIEKRVFNLLENVHAFYELYRDEKLGASIKKPEARNILDKWILLRLDNLIDLSTSRMDAYQLLEPVRAIRDFIDDLSTWYLRRSRDRLKQGDKEAKTTLYYTLKTLSKLLAPFAPFYAEELYQKLRLKNEPESVHLADWPEAKKSFNFLGLSREKVLENMTETRRIVSLALEARSRANIKIRQPLESLTIGSVGVYEELIKDEVNVKKVIRKDIEGVELDTALTPELIEEGEVREIIRSIQDTRKDKGLHPRETLKIPIPEDKKELYSKYKEMIVSATNVEFVSE